MRVLVFTCDPYYELIDGFSKQFNKHWGSEQVVDVLGFSNPDFELPDNFVFHSAGRQNDFAPMAFYEPFFPIIDSFPEDYFAMFLEDTFLIRAVDKSLLKSAERIITKKHADSVAMFWGGPEQFEKTTEFDNDFLEYPQDMNYRVNVQPQIITKDYFFRYMKPGVTMRDYEVNNITSARNNGATLLCAKKPIAPWVNVLRHGSFNNKIIENLKKSNGKSFAWNDWQVIEEKDEETVYSYRHWSAKR